MDTPTKRPKLTALAVPTLPPGRHWDGQGLHLVVTAPSARSPQGQRSWALRVTLAGKKVDLGLGSATAVSLAAARAEAVEMRRLVRRGIDPRRQKSDVPTFEACAKSVHEEHKKTFRNRKHTEQWLQSLKNDVFPVIGALPVDRVTSADVLKVLATIWTEKPETARRVKQRLKAVLDYARAAGHRTGENPVEGITKALPKHKATDKGHFKALPYDEVATFIESLKQNDRVSTSVKLAFEFLILTAARTSEVIGATWSEIDTLAKCWTIPGERMKAGRPHRVPLSARAIQILDEAKAIREGEFVFPGGRYKHGLSNMAFLQVVRERMQREDVDPHGFRSSFRDWVEERTHTPHSVAEAALAHTVKNKTEAAYRRGDLFELRRALMETWAAHCAKTRAKVVNIAQRSH